MLFIWVDNALYTSNQHIHDWEGAARRKNNSSYFVCPLFEQQQQQKKYKKMAWRHVQLIFSSRHQDFECNRIFILHWNVYRRQLRIEFLNEVDKYFDEKNRLSCKKKKNHQIVGESSMPCFLFHTNTCNKSAALSPHRPYTCIEKSCSVPIAADSCCNTVWGSPFFFFLFFW